MTHHLKTTILTMIMDGGKMIIALPNYIKDEIDKRVDEFIKINPEINREELYQDMVNIFYEYGDIPVIMRINGKNKEEK